MTAHTTEPRNRVYPASEDEMLRHLFDAERAAYAATRDALPRYADRYVWEDEGGSPPGGTAGGRQTAAVIGVIVCGALLLAGLAYLAWSGAHGSYIWAR